GPPPLPYTTLFRSPTELLGFPVAAPTVSALHAVARPGVNRDARGDAVRCEVIRRLRPPTIASAHRGMDVALNDLPRQPGATPEAMPKAMPKAVNDRRARG